ncbi:hypothetical protein BBAD15_g1860 [Beauveria bassiana D1-5]|uniref:Uncharacterized protein n=1 Tax=Beauveria bassiana D1-5 TaxID=1245745 RepID=A0A0A2VWV0_BEABA|nr:hypothetical protein BBAD15_g1860 [Beauveria bassiana D1-5]
MTSLFSMAAAAAAETVEDSSCDCFPSNGTNPGYYSKHAFFDFRQLLQHAGVPGVVDNAASAASAPESSDFFTSDAWTSFWEVENWNNSNGAASNGRANTLSNDATIYMVNSPSNIYIAKAADDGGGGGGGGDGRRVSDRGCRLPVPLAAYARAHRRRAGRRDRHVHIPRRR